MLRNLLIAVLFINQMADAQNVNTTSSYFNDVLTDWTSANFGELEISKEFTDKHNGVTHIYGVQSYKGLAIHPAFFDVHLHNKSVVAKHQNFVKLGDKSFTISKGELGAQNALELAFKFANMNPKSGFGTSINIEWKDQNSFEVNDKALSSEPISGKKVWFYKANILHEAWLINILTTSKSNWWNLYIATNSGDILEKIDWILSCNPKDCGIVHQHKIPNLTGHSVQQTNATPNQYSVFSIPIESPIYGSQTVVINPRDSMSSPYGWHDVNGITGAEYTITRGNNVYARDDKDANDAGGYSPDGGSDLIFNAAFDITKPASDYLDASIINLFYMNNVMHDVWYHYGFDEGSGNFQQKNYSNAGAGNDYVFADAQDGSGTNNANFGTPTDGQNPRMQMFLWNGGSTVASLLQVNSPSGIAGKYGGVQAGFTPQLTKTPITAKLVLAASASNNALACDAITNASSVANKIVLIDRGNCTFVEKIIEAQKAGALAVIIANNVSGSLISMGGSSTGITIPAIMISLSDANILKAQLSNNLTVSLYDSTGSSLKVFDSDFDNGVIAHEYGHGISNRLTGGAMNSSCLTNQEQMGEGWSDFFALVMSHEPGDKGTDSRGIGNYLTGENQNGNGIRTYPYSTNKNISKYTYNSIKTLSVPHGVGSVWSAMLWDLYWAMIDKHGFDKDIYYGTGGNNMAMQLVIDGLKLQPCNPGFVDGRNAILLADRINNKGANQLLIWEIFAARGLGFSANQGSTNSRTDGAEGYDIPPTLNNTPYLSKQANTETKSGDTLTYSILIKNLTPNKLYELTFNDTLGAGVTYLNSTGCAFVNNGNTLHLVIDSMQIGDSLMCSYSVKLSNASFTEITSLDSVEGTIATWNVLAELGTNAFKLVQNKAKSGKNSLFVSNPATQSDQSIWHAYNLVGLNKPALQFYHLYNTEDGWDGAVVEIRTKGKTTWTDAGPYFIKGNYNNFIATNPQSALSERAAFTGNSAAFIQSILDLSSFSGEEIEVRFRFASDGAASGEGWYIDDIALLDLHFVTNKADAKAKNGKSTYANVVSIVYKGETGTGVSVQNINATGLNISPNPVRNRITIQLDKAEKTGTNLVVFNQLGVAVYNQSITQELTNIEVSLWPAGLYYFNVKSQGEIKIYKVIKY
jgi:extracellular elastinolytic metalloproteinase